MDDTPIEKVVQTPRLFKVYRYGGTSKDFELVFAKTDRMAAEITQTIWKENGADVCHFDVTELRLPEGFMNEGPNKFVGLVYEPNKLPVLVIL